MKIKILYILPILIAVFFAGYSANSEMFQGLIGKKSIKTSESVENKTASTPCIKPTTNKTGKKPGGSAITDINPPRLQDIDLSKVDLEPRERFTVLINSEEDLMQAEASIDGQNYNLPALEWSSGTYYNTVNAPADEGEWSIKITLTDLSGNELIVDEAATITVENNSADFNKGQMEFFSDQPTPPSPGQN